MRHESAQSRLEQEGRTLVERLGGRWGLNGGMCRCPAHDDRTPSLSVRPGRSRLLFHCFAGCAAADVLAALERDRLLEPAPPGIPVASYRTDGADKLAGAALRIWSDSRSIHGTPAEHYLTGRGLATNSPELRYHPRTPRGRAPLTRFEPALIAAVRDECGTVAIHRTFLSRAAGARRVRVRVRAGLGRYGGGAVRLGGSAATLGLAEGIETALSATAMSGIPCWATLGTERFALVTLPRDVEQLVLFLDHDAGGRRAEALARQAFGQRLPIETRYPDRPGDDWNDALLRELAGMRGKGGEEAGRG
jgi:hypothetical protein